jgi:DNA-binding transcriptional MocR family regulator
LHLYSWHFDRGNEIIATMAIWTPAIEARTGPRARAIAEAIGEDIASGRLKSGDRLPPQRDLADALSLSANTVMRAYAEATRRGYVEGEVGRGTFVRPAAVPSPGHMGAGMQRQAEGPIDFSLNLPFIGDAKDALSATLGAIARSGELAAYLDYDNASARSRHAEAGAQWLRRIEVPAGSERIVLTNGAQQGIFASLMALLRPGDLLLSDHLIYAPVKAMARHLGVKLAALRADEEGLLPDALANACRRSGAKVLYCTPTLHTPTTTTMSEGRRQEIARIATAEDLFIVEDDVFGFLPATRPPPLAAMAPAHTIFTTSVSKSLAPGLRVGYVHAPERLAPAIRSAVGIASWMPPSLMGEIARRWIEDGTAVRLNEAQRAHAARRQAMARRALAGHAYKADPHGFHLWLPLPEGWQANAFADAAKRDGVLLNPARSFAVSSEAPEAVRLCLSHEMSDDRAMRGLAVIAALLEHGENGDVLVI